MSKLYKALADFQQEVPAIYKGTSGYGYKYADWGEILSVINPLLAKHNLGFSQPLDGNQVKTVVFHTETGETIESVVDIPQGVELKGMNDFQVLGSAITYLRRYSLSSLLGLVTDEDADAAGQQTAKKATKSPLKTREDGHDAEILARAKKDINSELERQGYDTPEAKTVFITRVLKHSIIQNLDEANLVADELDNVAGANYESY